MRRVRRGHPSRGAPGAAHRLELSISLPPSSLFPLLSVSPPPRRHTASRAVLSVRGKPLESVRRLECGPLRQDREGRRWSLMEPEMHPCQEQAFRPHVKVCHYWKPGILPRPSTFVRGTG